MSTTDDKQHLLADMEDDLGVDDDSFAAMQQMMGFSSFGGPQKPKRQPKGPGQGRGFGTGANSQPIQPRTASVSTSTSTVTTTLPSKPGPPTASQPPPTTTTTTLHPFIPASLPPPVSSRSKSPHQQPTTSPASTHQQDTPNNPPPSFQPPPKPTEDRIAYTHPTTGYTLTQRELGAYERGVVTTVSNTDGTSSQVKVFFKPSFIEENPWAGLEGGKGRKER